MPMNGSANDALQISTFYGMLFNVLWILFFIVFFTSLMVWFFRWISFAAEEESDSQQSRRAALTAESSKESSGRAVLWWGLAAFWLLDAVLQAQPLMVTSVFVHEVLLPAAKDQPQWLRAMMNWGIEIWEQNPITYNLITVVLQAVIGSLMVFGRRNRLGTVGLCLGAGWSLVLWVFGEGMGGLWSGGMSFMSGAPGSAFLYLVCTVMLLLPKNMWQNGQIQRRLRQCFAGFWLLMAILQSLPSAGFWQPGGLTTLFGNASSMPQPQFLAKPIELLAMLTFHFPVLWNGVCVGIMLVLSYGFWKNIDSLWLMIVTGIWLLFAWWMGQDFGVLGGLGTDPNSAPVLALLLVAGKWGIKQATNRKSTRAILSITNRQLGHR
ncbi:hypothetical protein LSG31_18430 [Fodinisporobacter ferrooxydans]|uniref:Uncharacterized protein n=1 Tax=Fodinisporobacter ferrooxydans TaxID=2901836 RepID=A0ABY4CHD3_9BACL|nr:hypothetical protein LSG31_18430 [Alicyclobacillaceae bacterium MYW30-H2]